MKVVMQRLSTVFCLCALVIAEPQVPSKSYLPPEEGYSYGAPSVPFPSPSPSPSSYYPQPTYRPSPSPKPRPPPIYSTVSPTYPSYPSASYTPSYSTPKPFSVKPTYGVPSYDQSGSHISAGSIDSASGGGEFDHLKQPHVPGMPFDFSYAVKDDYYGTDFAHSANSNGDQVRGEYRVLLPDGRLQIVKYIADWKDGYTAEVTYQGEAKYPTGAPANSGSAINAGGYKPQPSPYPSPKPTGGYGGASYAGAQQTLAFPGYPSGPQPSAYPSKPPSYAGAQQPISGYGGSQQYSSQPAQGYSSAPDYGSSY